MLLYVMRRLLTAIPTMFVIVTLAFFLIRVAPGGPFNQERGLSPRSRPIWKRSSASTIRSGCNMSTISNNLLHGNFGPSYNLPDFTVGELFASGLPISIQLGASALILALIVGAMLGIIAALNQNKVADYAVIATATAGSTIPTFVIAPVIQLLFGLTWMLLPIGGWGDGAFVNKIGPVMTLALPQIAIVARLMRGSMIESLRSHHIRTARALGLSDWSVVVRHALRGAVLPIVSYAGPAAAALLTGSIIVETIFAIPGVGRYFVDAALNRDYTLVMGTVVVIAMFTILFNLIVDILYAVVDPRVRYD